MATQSKPKKAKQTRSHFGSVRTLPSGRIQASYVGPDAIRHNAPNTFDNLTDARAWLAMQQADIVREEWDSVSVVAREASKQGRGETFRDYALKWIDERVNASGDPLADRTVHEYRRMVTHTLSELGNLKLNAITPTVVREWNAAHIRTGKRTQTAHAYSLLSTILATAVSDHRIQQNPCLIRGAKNARTGKEVVPPTFDELNVIVDAINDRYKLMVLIAAWGSLRFGEITELRRSDLILERDDSGQLETVIVNVSRAVVKLPGGVFKVKQPKTKGSVRQVVMPDIVNAAVEHHLTEYVGQADDALLFPGTNSGGHMNVSALNRVWYRARAAANRSDLPFHGLRHFGGTFFAQSGATLKETQDRLGHVTVRAAMRYQHSTGRDRELAKGMSERAKKMSNR